MIWYFLSLLKFALPVFSGLFLYGNILNASDDSFCDPENLEIVTTNKLLLYKVEVADTVYKRQKGLMNRKHLPSNRGMLFIFDRLHYAKMWMKNTSIVLDIIFVNELGIITKIVREAEPFSLEIHSSNRPIKFVLEVPSFGKNSDLINVGNSISHCYIENK